jgi:hypothetical protein
MALRAGAIHSATRTPPFTFPAAGWTVEARLRWQRSVHCLPLHGVFPGGDGYIVPLWMPFILIAVPVGALWYRDRRPPPGHCQRCGYDLTGNVSGRCSECGVEVQA